MMLRSAFRSAAVPSTRSWRSSTTLTSSSSSSSAFRAVTFAGVGRWARCQSTAAESAAVAAARTPKAPSSLKKEPASSSEAKADEALLNEALVQAFQEMERAASVEETPVTVDGYGDYPDVPSALPQNANYDPAQLPLPLTSPPGTLTEEQHSASLVRGRSLSEPVYHKPLYQIPVASLHLRSYNPAALDFFAHFASHAAASLGIPISKPVHLPTQRSMWTVPRSPFAHKKSQENFERKTYKRAIKAWDASPEVVDLWCQYMSRHSLHGVGMKVTKWEHHDLGAADAMYEEAANVRKDAFEEMRKQKDGIKQTAEKIIKEETKPTETTT